MRQCIALLLLMLSAPASADEPATVELAPMTVRANRARPLTIVVGPARVTPSIQRLKRPDLVAHIPRSAREVR